MKKTGLFLVVMIATMVMGNTNAQAATKYGLLVGETWVTSDNANDILGDGHFKYDASTKTLTVTSATLNNQGSQGSGISNREVDGLTIKLIGTSTFTTRMAVIGTERQCKITGTGVLVGASTTDCGFYLSGESPTIIVDGPRISVTGKLYAIDDYRGNGNFVVKGSSQVTLTPGSGHATIHHLKWLTLDNGIYISDPAFVNFSTSLMSLTSDGTNPYKGKVVISSTPTFYGMFIGETSVSAANAGNILNDAQGTFRFDPATRTLTVMDANLNSDGYLGGGIDNREVEGLIIQFIGDNVFNTRNNLIVSGKSLTIKGPGTLTGTASQNSGIELYGEATSCILDNGLQLDITGATYALEDYSSTASVTIKHKDTCVKLKSGRNQPPIYHLKSLTLDNGLYVTLPDGGYFDKTLQSITTDGKNAYKGEVVISNQQPAWMGIDDVVAGKQRTTEVYDLNGRRLGDKPSQRGTYIYGGKKPT